MMQPEFHIGRSRTASVVRLADDSWRLEIPAGVAKSYRLAQLDDHWSLQRQHYPWRPPLTMSLEARVSGSLIPGTWGFGLWNDPMSVVVGYSGIRPSLPTLPDAAWFFYASPESYLSFRDDLPANGLLAATFESKKQPTVLLLLLLPLIGLMIFPGTAQLLRRLLRRPVRQDAVQVATTVTEWHHYQIEWKADGVVFSVDDICILETTCAPKHPLSLVLWVDNQYAALPPRGGFKYGYLPNPEPAWLEFKDFSIQRNA